MPEINIQFTENPYTHALMLDSKIEFIKNIKNATNCDMRSAKIAAEEIEGIILGLEPTVMTTRNRIDQILNSHEQNAPGNLQFLLDVLQFMKTNLSANVPRHVATSTFKENGEYQPYEPVKKKSTYHACTVDCHHKCEELLCDDYVLHHDQPYCSLHSLDSGPTVKGYDSRNEL